MDVEDALEWIMEDSSTDSGLSDDGDIINIALASSSSSDSDEPPNDNDRNQVAQDLLFPIMQLLMHGRRRERIDNYIDHVHQYSNNEFKEHFRMSRETAYRLIGFLDESGFIPSQHFGPVNISAEWSFLITLWYLANTEPLRTISDRFDVSISSVWRVLRRVVAWLLSRMNAVVCWPTGRRIAEVCNAFQEKQGIPKIIGAIDGSHIPIRSPPEHQRDFVNRKGWHSIVLQAVVTADLKFIDLYCGEPGSVHDARVFRRSELYRRAEANRNNVFPDNTFLIGDSAYPSLPYLVPPFRDNGHLTPQQVEFNYIHSSTRMAVEKAFGVLKARFRRLKGFELLITEDIIDMTLACCVLHNYCIDFNDVEVEDVQLEDELEPAAGSEHDDSDDNGQAGGNQLRRRNVQDRRSQVFEELFPPAIQMPQRPRVRRAP